MIVATLVRMIVREHMHKPLGSRILTLGRQTIAMTYEQCLTLFKQEKYEHSNITEKHSQLEIDKKTRIGKGTGYISDSVFFELLGIPEVVVMDVSSYEQSDILHDLNYPVPESLIEQFDFIIDGGTFDHLGDIRTAFSNVIKMLKPNGRIFQWNAASNFTGAAYVSFGPDFFYDFYVLNRFKDCKVYIAEVDRFGQQEFWDIYEFKGSENYEPFESSRILMVIVLAEKDDLSTWDKLPIQAQYRDKHLCEAYLKGCEIISISNRKSWQGIITPWEKYQTVAGFKYMGKI